MFVGGSKTIDSGISQWINDIKTGGGNARFPNFSFSPSVSCGYFLTTQMNEDERDKAIEGADFEVTGTVIVDGLPVGITGSFSLDGDPTAIEVGTPNWGAGVSYTRQKVLDFSDTCEYVRNGFRPR